MLKKCKKCGEEKSLECFRRQGKGKPRRADCKACWVDSLKDRERRMLKKYNLNLNDYEKMLVAQNGVCANCKKPETLNRKGTIQPLSVDHNHQTGRVRALLCNACNSLLGNAKENIQILQAAIRYLQEHENYVPRNLQELVASMRN
jgi:hypothetical protein